MKNKKIWNVLVFPGGTENGIEINKSLRYAKEVKLHSASNDVKNHAEYMYKNHHVIPDIRSKNCIKELNKIIHKNEIDFIFPANSLVIDFLIENRNQITCKVILPNSNAVKITRSKNQTYELFKDLLIDTLYLFTFTFFNFFLFLSFLFSLVFNFIISFFPLF